jgi:cell shape-determining protein MreC
MTPTEHKHPEVNFSWQGPRLTAVMTVGAMMLTFWATQALNIERMNSAHEARITTIEKQMMEFKRIQDENTAARILLLAKVEEQSRILQEVRAQDMRLYELLQQHERQSRARIKALEPKVVP